VPSEGMEVSEVLRNKTFYMILLIMSFGIIGPGTIVTFYKASGSINLIVFNFII
jgi:hypothetical protein